MTNIAREVKNIKNEVVRQMKGLGVFKKEYMSVINIYAQMLAQYESFQEQFELSGFQIEEEYTNKAGATNMRKTPLFSAMEKLRMDIAVYAKMLCLNPKSIEGVTVEKVTKSNLASALSVIDD